MAPSSLCAGCQQKLPIRETLICSLCKSRYDLECAGVAKEYYLKSMTLELRNSWTCQTCICKIPKTGNTNTPIRPQKNPEYDCLTTSTVSNNVTTRKKTINPINDTFSSENLSLIGDTLQAEDIAAIDINNSLINPLENTQVQLNMQSLSELIILRLKENNKSIIVELQNTIQTEINRAIAELKLDFDFKLNTLTIENEQRKREIENINTKIATLQLEKENLKREVRELSPQTFQAPNVPENQHHKLVLYGLTEYYQEPEGELYNRLIALFRDIVNVDLSGYIEDMYRVGRKGTQNRPLVIELLSKRMTRYIVTNNQWFQGTGLGVSEFLDTNSRKQRAQMREELFKARQNGHHAVIKNKVLYIDGKPVNKTYDNIKPQDIDATYQENNMSTMSTSNQSHHIMPNEYLDHTFRNRRPRI